MQLFIFGLALASYFALHSFLADLNVKELLQKRWIAKKYYRIFYNFTALGLLIPIFLFYKKINATLFFENVLLQNIGIGIVIFGILLLLVALRQYNLSEFSGTQQLKQNLSLPTQSLKTSGFNSIVRHPLYFSGLIILWGSFLFRPTDLVLMVSLVSTAYLYFGTKLEERKLVVEFGEEYLEYQKEVGMLIPYYFFKT